MWDLFLTLPDLYYLLQRMLYKQHFVNIFCFHVLCVLVITMFSDKPWCNTAYLVLISTPIALLSDYKPAYLYAKHTTADKDHVLLEFYWEHTCFLNFMTYCAFQLEALPNKSS